MKPYHKSYWKTIIFAAGCGGAVSGVAAIGFMFGSDLASKVDIPSLAPISKVASAILLSSAVLCFAVATGGLLSLYRDITRGGKP